MPHGAPPSSRRVGGEGAGGPAGRRRRGWRRLQPGLGGVLGTGGGPAAPPGPSGGPRPSDGRRGAGPLPASESRPPPPARLQPTRHSSGAHVTWSSRQRKCSSPPPHLPPPPLSGPLRPQPHRPHPLPPDGQLLTELQGRGSHLSRTTEGLHLALWVGSWTEPWGDWGRGGGRGRWEDLWAAAALWI